MMTGVINLKLFIDKLITKIKQKNSHICVGLDPHLHLIPEFLLEKAAEETTTREEALGLAIWRFNREIIDHIKDFTAVVKPQIALYEKIGLSGIKALYKTINYAHENNLLVLLDAKRNDIGSTAQAYAEAYLKNDNIDAITVNPYLGNDGIKPFLKYEDKGAFALVRTSNQSAVEIQDIKTTDNKYVYQKVGELVTKWGNDLKGQFGYSNLGAVVGATYPDELKTLRKSMPDSYFLIPGYGAQGGGVKDILDGFNSDQLGAIVNSSRGIIFAYKKAANSDTYLPQQFAEAARKEAKKMRDDINMELMK